MRGLELTARAAQLLMGAVLLLSGIIKVWEPVLFYWEVVPYTQLLGVTENWQAMSLAALAVAPLECTIGLALLANWRPRLFMPVAVVLMTFFIALMVLAWKVGATEECGCFGALLQRSPGQAAVEDVVMLVLLLLGWWGSRRHAAWRGGGALVVGGTVLALLVGALRFVPERERLTASDLLPGVQLKGVAVKGVDVDLRRGEYLIELFSPHCGRCLHSVPKLNAFAQMADLPSVVGLSSFAHDDVPMVEFIRRSGAAYPIGTITKTDFFRLTWGHGFPRMALLRDGQIIQVWEYNELPTEAAVRQAVRSLRDAP